MEVIFPLLASRLQAIVPYWRIVRLPRDRKVDRALAAIRAWLSPIVAEQPFFLGSDYTLVDAYLGPLLWRLPYLGIELPDQAAPLIAYGESLFRRPSFQASLSELEMDLR
jgi:glutathione S-transferase